MTKKSVLSKLLILSLAAAFILFKPLPAHTQGVEGVEGVDYLSGELIVKYTSAEVAETSSSEKSRAFYGVNSSALNNFLRNLFGTTSLADLDREFAVYEKIPFFAFADGDGQRQSRTIKLGQLGTTPPPEQTTSLIYLLKFRQKTVAEAVAAYDNHSDVEYAEPDYIVKAFEIPNDPLYPQLWGLEKIQMPQAWDITQGSADVIVGVLDTGADYNQPDLAGNLIAGYDIVNGDSDPRDDHGHGTHVAGTIGAVGNNNLLVAGINWEVSLMPVKVLNASGSGSDWWVAQGIYWAVDHGAKVINMSLGGRYPSQTVRNAISYATTNSVTPVAAAGNDNSSAPNYPAQYPGVISVAASTQSDSRASFSNFNPDNDISAPGVSICSTTVGGGYKCWAGTSMASPHVAGAAALLLAQNSGLSLADITQRLKSTADAVSDSRIPKRLNLYRALSEDGGPTPTSGPTNTPAPTITPGGPTLTPLPTTPTGDSETPAGPVSSCPEVKRDADVAIWNCLYDAGQELLLEDGVSLPKGRYVAICYNRLAGSVSLTVDRGGELVNTYSGNFSSSRRGGCLHSGSRIYFLLGELASPAGSEHIYTINTGGKTAATSVLVTK